LFANHFSLVLTKPDFIYKAAKLAVFCDGSAHDHPEQQEQDRIDRDNLKYAASYYVLTLRHDQDWKVKLEVLASLL
jgi:very-short-patch-repair endonuclease